ATPGRGGVQVDAKGAAVAPALPVQGSLTVQVANDATASCFSTTWSGADVRKSDATRFEAALR
ncbi:MAG: hypothetical protein ACKPBU_02275, partial [Alphaproteobacteria bacterium]